MMVRNISNTTLFVLLVLTNHVKAQSTFPPMGNEFMAATGDAVRSPCPAINTLANHGFLNRDGKAVALDDLRDQLVENFAFTAGVVNGPIGAAQSNGLTYMLDGVEVMDIDSLHALGRQASFVRVDRVVGGDQFEEVDQDLVDALTMDTAAGSPVLTRNDLQLFQGMRAVNSLKIDENLEFSDGMIGAMSTQATFLLSFGQRADLDFVPKDYVMSFLGMEKFPEGFDPDNYVIAYDFSDGSSSAMARTEFRSSLTNTIALYEDPDECNTVFSCLASLLSSIAAFLC